jgi:phage terminase large subunit
MHLKHLRQIRAASADIVVRFMFRRVLDYIEGVGQVLGYYTDLLRQKGYSRAICHLPHDGVNSNAITGKRYSDHLSDAGFDVPPPVPN